MINNLEELAAFVGAAHPTKESIGRRLYKDTSCGISFEATPERVLVAGYAEGSAAELPWHTLNFPFAEDAWMQAVAIADEEGSEEWDEANNPPAPEGLRKKYGVEVGCENPECLNCYESDS